MALTLHDNAHRVARVISKPAEPSRNMYAHVQLEFVYLADDGRSFEDAFGTDVLDELELDVMVSDSGQIYQWYCRYGSLYHADLHDLEPRVKLLKATFAKLAAWDKQWGECSSFGVWAFRICKHLAVTRYIREDERPLSGDDWGWEARRTDTLAYHLDHVLTQMIYDATHKESHVQSA